jgi:putative endonuclease
MYYVYILHSEILDKFYVGFTNNLERRLIEHNELPGPHFTNRFRPWKLIASFDVGNSKSLALSIERHIKRQKSKLYIKKLVEQGNIHDLIVRYR